MNSININSLSSDCLQNIFQLLPIADRIKVERVCKHWQNLSKDSWYNFKKLDLKPQTWYSKDLRAVRLIEIEKGIFYQVLSRCGKYLKSIILDAWVLDSIGLLINFANFCPNLTVIDISKMEISPTDIRAFNTQCSNITEFYITFIHKEHDVELRSFFSKQKKLKIFKMSKSSVDLNCLSYLSENSMTDIYLNKCNLCNIWDFIKHLKNLHVIKIIECKKNLYHRNVTESEHRLEQDLPEMNFPNLVILQIQDISCYSSKNWELSNIFSNLEILHLTSSYHIVNDNILRIIGENCKLLKSIDISGHPEITDVGMRYVTSLPLLECLHARNSLGITEKPFERLGNMENIRVIDLLKCWNLTNKISVVLTNCPKLEYLDVGWSPKITNELLNIAVNVAKNRTNNIVLELHAFCTKVNKAKLSKTPNFILRI